MGDPQSTPYRDAAQTYRAAGWVGVLPIPYRTKALRGRKAVGWTGREGAWPSFADIQAWIDSDLDDEGGGNIALRMPPDVIGIDVDNYGDKHGATDLAAAVANWGPLPDSWTSTARDDGISGIRMYRVPEGLRWPGQVGPSIEVIQTAHRYAVVWPSVHPEGRVYRWYRPDGMASLAPPRVDELPELPDMWIVGLTGGELAEHVNFASLSSTEVNGWLTTHAAGTPCRAMRVVADRLHHELRTGSAHESLRRLLGLARLAEQGHTGLAEVLGEAYTAFMGETTSLGRGGSTRDPQDAKAEWSRSLGGAVRRVLGNASVADVETSIDPCTQPFAGLVAPGPTATAVPLVVPTPAVQATVPTPATPPAATPAPAPAAAPPLVVPSAADVLFGTDTPQPAAAAPVVELVEVPEPPAVEHTTWWPRDLAAVLAGEQTEPEPSVLTRDDGKCLFYAGKVNGLLGESESGKSWLLLAAIVQQLEAGHPVLYVDFEDTANSVVARLVAMGIDTALLAPEAGLFAYISPDEGLNVLAAADLAEVLMRAPYSLIGLDGVNAAMTLLGLDLTSNTDATKFSQLLLKPLAKTGASVVTVDHVPKSSEQRGKGGIGAQAKRAMVTGCAILVEVLAPFGRGTTGKLRLTVDKDRPGHVRGHSQFSKNAGVAVLESGSNGSVNIRLEAPNMSPDTTDRKPFRPTSMMEKVSRLLSTTDGDLSQTQIEESIEGRTNTIREALARLVEEGYVSRHAGPRNSMRHRYERTYREMSELVGGEAGDGPDEY